ncbi:hypothetical protein [Algoriphagus limi]|uniref:Small multi-drug export protein n=1 Tax=Algoriphagus limi TaxID=2975273 RepID=A0ABT2G6V2_9BACT|nr:hypothetical protein [Algoriphagus limi]MCS5490508.1 hypothetical protein [Algoriphagus limi]
MNESLISLIGIYFLGYFKFIAGPILVPAAGFGVGTTIFITVSSMMSSVFIFTLIGKKFKKKLLLRFRKKKPVFTSRNRKIVTVWKKYGEIGIAFLTPLILTPIGGTLILVSFGSKKRRIYFHMFWSALFWATIFSFSIDKLLQIPILNSLLG